MKFGKSRSKKKPRPKKFRLGNGRARVHCKPDHALALRHYRMTKENSRPPTDQASLRCDLYLTRINFSLAPAACNGQICAMSLGSILT